ncbi:MAG: TraB/GumN family protein [Bacteroidetes bacterium]|nr:TraB/GumN family protein [Bacteroidota bacterium]
MKYTLTLAFLLALQCGFCSNQKNEKKNNPTKALIDSNNSLLWQISGNGLKQSSYLFGTIHIIPEEDYFLGKNVQKKMKQSSLLVMELDLSNVNIAAISELSVLDSGKTIQSYMSDSDFATLQAFMFDTLGIDQQVFNLFYSRLNPFFLEQLIFLNHVGPEKESYEINLKSIAENNKIPQSGLETMEEQLQFLKDVPIEIQLKNILNTIRNYSSETATLDTLVDAYKKQDLTYLNKAFEAEEDTSWKENLLDKRNKNWIPKIKDFITKQACFIAVGAGHLGGENGLIALLRKEGYTVEPLPIN